MHLIRSALLLVTMAFGLVACHAPEDLHTEPELLVDKAAATDVRSRSARAGRSLIQRSATPVDAAIKITGAKTINPPI